MLALQPQAEGLALLECAAEAFEISSLCLVGGPSGKTQCAGKADPDLVSRTHQAYLGKEDRDEPGEHLSIRCLSLAEGVVGAIGFRSSAELGGLAGLIAALLGTALERARAVDQLSHSRALAESEALRGAILDMLAHEFRTPLATISTLAGALIMSDNASESQRETAQTIEDEAAHLNRLSSRLLSVARLERQEIRLNLEIIDLRYVV